MEKEHRIEQTVSCVKTTWTCLSTSFLVLNMLTDLVLVSLGDLTQVEQPDRNQVSLQRYSDEHLWKI